MMNQGCKFCRIIAGEMPAQVIFTDETLFVFLDQRPLFPGHCLLVPKSHYQTLQEVPGELLYPLFAMAQLLSRAMEEGLGAEGSFVAINNRISQSVPHVHIHVVPRRRKDGLKGFFWPRHRYRDEEHLREVQRLLQDTVSRLRAEAGLR
jgi:histidine triad (HIT) family protein